MWVGLYRGVEQLVARQSHKLEVVGSSPTLPQLFVIIGISTVGVIGMSVKSPTIHLLTPKYYKDIRLLEFRMT